MKVMGKMSENIFKYTVKSGSFNDLVCFEINLHVINYFKKNAFYFY